ncbi:hypothetical protein C2G38_2142676 [Gigaspora rosea]|uniref:Zinc/iron permease n=1 Tax=Gigaspora rosea TaxID=44941 RepID=A0A397V5Q5_9GLOM|nr:hypothetical protein C2G38_2142676 [Gigaspora rosea]
MDLEHQSHQLKTLGIQVAIALGIHILPEGLIISLPIYFSTGSRWKSFLIAGSIGISAQMLGAIFGYVLFVTYWNDGVSAILFAIISAVLLYNVLHGMIPLANKYDPEDEYRTYSLFGGIIFFAIVEALFDISGTNS